MVIFTHEDDAGIVYGITRQVYWIWGHGYDGNEKNWFLNHGWGRPLCERLVADKISESENPQSNPETFTFPGADKQIALPEFVNMSACNLIKNMCSIHESLANYFNSFTFDYVVKIEDSFGSGTFSDVSGPPFTVTTSPLQLTISGSTQLASFYDGPINF